MYHLIICFLKIFKPKKFGMRFWGVNFWSRDFWGFVRSRRDFVLVLFFAPIHLKSGVSPGLLPDYHMQFIDLKLPYQNLIVIDNRAVQTVINSKRCLHY